MTTKVLKQADADPEPQLAASERGLRGPGAGAVWTASARVVDPHDYQLYTWEDWTRLVPKEDEPFVQSVRLRVRVPEVVALTHYDRTPAAPVTFSRRNIFKRDHSPVSTAVPSQGSTN